MEHDISRNQRILMAMQEKLASLLEFAEKVNIVMEECIEAEESNDTEAEMRIVREIDMLDQEVDELVASVSQAEMDEMAHALGPEALERNVAWLMECRARLDDLVEEYESAMHKEHDLEHAVRLRQDIKKLGHDLVRGHRQKASLIRSGWLLS